MSYNFHNNQVIRYKKTGKLYLLLQALKTYYLVVDLQDKDTPQNIKVVLFKDIKYFVPDYEVECKEKWQPNYWQDYQLEFKVRRQVAI